MISFRTPPWFEAGFEDVGLSSSHLEPLERSGSGLSVNLAMEEFLTEDFLDSLFDDVQNSVTEGAVEDVLLLPPLATANVPSATVALPATPETASETARAAPRRYTCLYTGCAKAFRRHEHLKNHVRAVHRKKKEFHCPVCAKAFATPSALGVHMRVHNDERPFACPHPGCDRRFRQKMHMNRHTRVHTKEQPFVCNVCNRAFSQISSMKRHMRIIHADTPISLFGA